MTVPEPGKTYIAWPVFQEYELKLAWRNAIVVRVAHVHNTIQCVAVRPNSIWVKGEILNFAPTLWDYWPCL